MDVQDGSAPYAAARPEPEEELPDLMALGLAELGRIDHPVLRAVVADLRERAARPDEMLWGHSSAL
ncbi:FxSxx-COOH cyclophane-containing RiPP peptide [Streptomyces sp. AF1A]|jgi:FXSXX-COOH protein|uniref:FxSxx-COOH cyclophane-containing RiPP peptide n=1 Tax=Streptomyces sp. AF1A TaxID=3394350 RepID=UPI0039BCA340